MRPSGTSMSLAQSRCSTLSASRPCRRNLAKEVWSKIAAALRVAQANARVQRATLFPTVQSSAGASALQVPTILSPPLSDGTTYNYSLYTLGLTVSYNLDLWGGTRRAIESADALAEAQCFQLEGAYLSLASNVVAAAILEAGLREQVKATQDIIASQRDTLNILTRQSGLGAVTGADAPLAEQRWGAGRLAPDQEREHDEQRRGEHQPNGAADWTLRKYAARLNADGTVDASVDQAGSDAIHAEGGVLEQRFKFEIKKPLAVAGSPRP